MRVRYLKSVLPPSVDYVCPQCRLWSLRRSLHRDRRHFATNARENDSASGSQTPQDRILSDGSLASLIEVMSGESKSATSDKASTKEVVSTGEPRKPRDAVEQTTMTKSRPLSLRKIHSEDKTGIRIKPREDTGRLKMIEIINDDDPPRKNDRSSINKINLDMRAEQIIGSTDAPPKSQKHTSRPSNQRSESVQRSKQDKASTMGSTTTQKSKSKSDAATALERKLKAQMGSIRAAIDHDSKQKVDQIETNLRKAKRAITRRKPETVRKVRVSKPSPNSDSSAARATKGTQKVTKASPSANSLSTRGPRILGLTKVEPVTVSARSLAMQPVEVEQPPVPSLAYGLERVLFNPGVYQLQDPRSRVFNFDPYLQKIMPVAEFEFNALKKYITSSKDSSLKAIANRYGKRYIGSTSSMTAMLAHFHFLLSQWRPVNISMLSKAFPDRRMLSFTELQRSPAAIFLRWNNGTYAIDADKEFDSGNILSMLGKSMEKLLTLRTTEFEKYRRSSTGQLTDEDTLAPESFHYSTMGDFLMRSQLDAYDPRLPGTGMFDLKTRAVVSIRMDVTEYEHGVGYEIKDRQGAWESYEREYFDMIRAAFLKYSMQVRMGRMDGIFVAFHNIERIFGFQYISLPEMDAAVHGQWDTSIGDQEFTLSLDLLNKILDKATKRFPETSIRLHFETREAAIPYMFVFAEPVNDGQIADIEAENVAKIAEYETGLFGSTVGEATQESAASGSDPNLLNSSFQDVGTVDTNDSVSNEQQSSPAHEQATTMNQASETGTETNKTESDPDSMSASDGTHTTPSVGVEDLHSSDKINAENPSAANDADQVEPTENPSIKTKAVQTLLEDKPTSKETADDTSSQDALYGMTVSIVNKINGSRVVRPEILGKDDEWTMQYTIADMEDPEIARSAYQALRARRKKRLEKVVKDDSDQISAYMKHLRELSVHGRAWREAVDKEDAKSPRKVL